MEFKGEAWGKILIEHYKLWQQASQENDMKAYREQGNVMFGLLGGLQSDYERALGTVAIPQNYLEAYESQYGRRNLQGVAD